MRVLRLLLALISVAAGVALGALNPQPVTLDLGFHAVHSTLGVVLLTTLLVGAVAGGLILLVAVVGPLKGALRRARAAQPARAVPKD